MSESKLEKEHIFIESEHLSETVLNFEKIPNGGSAAKVRAVIDKDIFTTDMFT